MSERRTVVCFVCHISERSRVILRFGLRLSWAPSGRRAYRMVGGIYMCEACWRESRKVRPRRGPHPDGHRRAVIEALEPP